MANEQLKNPKLEDLARTDPRKIIESMFYIVDKSGNRQPFLFNPIQNKFYEERSARDDVLKARKHGISSEVLAMFTTSFLFIPNTMCVCVSHTEKDTKILLDKVYYFIDNLPFKVTLAKSSAGWLRIDEMNTDFIIGTAGSKSFGRGSTIHKLHLSEFAFYSNPSMMTGLMNAVPDDLNNTWIVKETTANGYGNMHHKEWIEEKNGNSVFKPHFYSWFDNPEYKMRVTEDTVFSEKERLIQEKYNLSDEQLAWRQWKISSIQTPDGYTKEDMFMQEFPCIVEGTLVSDGFSTMKIEDVKENAFVHKVIDNGEKEVLEVITNMGYSVKCTPEHRIKTIDSGFIEARNLTKEDKVILSPLPFGKKMVTIQTDFLFSKLSINITERLAEFIGIYMGDGDFYYKDENGQSSTPSVGVACDGQCSDFVDYVCGLFDEFLGGYGQSIRGSKKGCVYIRKGNKDFKVLFELLDLIRLRDSGNGYKRKIHVPSYIFNSPKNIIKGFLKGIFETDGFVDRDGRRIVLFSKYKKFLQDIQLLLLMFGISSRIREAEKKTSGGKYSYIGYELVLRKMANLVFRNEIGFLSEKKKQRLALLSSSLGQNTQVNEIGFDNFKEIKSLGLRHVWDLTTETSEFIANSLVVHNCSDTEAFLSTGRPVFDPKTLDWYETALCIDVLDKGELFGWNPPTFQVQEHGMLRLYSKPKSGHTYVIGGDVAEDGDYSALVVLDRATAEEVALWHGHLDEFEFAQTAYRLGGYYNDALIGIERNNMGVAVVMKLDELGYVNQYRTETIDEIGRKVKDKLGWETTGATRPILISDLNQVLSEHSLIVRSRDIIGELKSFVRDKRGKPQAQVGTHDDLVMALGIAYQMYKTIPYIEDKDEVTVRNYRPNTTLYNFSSKK